MRPDRSPGYGSDVGDGSFGGAFVTVLLFGGTILAVEHPLEVGIGVALLVAVAVGVRTVYRRARTTGVTVPVIGARFRVYRTAGDGPNRQARWTFGVALVDTDPRRG